MDDATAPGADSVLGPEAAQSADRPTEEELDTVRSAACTLLDATFASLTDARVLPRPRFAPWIRMARDYYGDMLLGGADFEGALKALWPRRFDVSVGDPNIEFASTYERTLIEDAVQAATRSDEPFDSSSPSVRGAIERVIDRLQSRRVLRVANVVADLATEDDRPIKVGDVRLWSVPNGAERDLEREISRPPRHRPRPGAQRLARVPRRRPALVRHR